MWKLLLVVFCCLLASIVTSQNISITLYYESYCPGCEDFIINQIAPTLQAPGLKEIINLRLVPYGNAHEYEQEGKYVFQCQHGPKECEGNMLEQCVLHAKNDKVYDAFPIILCMEKKFQLGYSPSQAASECITDSSLFNEIKQCATGDLGNQLMHKNAVETRNLNPPHKFVPWVVVNGQPNTDITDNMLGWICNHYTGPKPEGCSKKDGKCWKYEIQY